MPDKGDEEWEKEFGEKWGNPPQGGLTPLLDKHFPIPDAYHSTHKDYRCLWAVIIILSLLILFAMVAIGSQQREIDHLKNIKGEAIRREETEGDK